jgi:hypothetical protein
MTTLKACTQARDVIISRMGCEDGEEDFRFFGVRELIRANWVLFTPHLLQLLECPVSAAHAFAVGMLLDIAQGLPADECEPLVMLFSPYLDNEPIREFILDQIPEQ